MPKKTQKSKKDYFVHPSAFIEDEVEIGQGTKIWHQSQVRKGAKLGKNCVVGKSVFIDFNSQIGDNVKIQNNAMLYHQTIIEDGVFIGPNVVLTNDRRPRAINPDGSFKSADDWEISTMTIKEGAAIGGHSVVTPGVTIGCWAMAGSGSVITRDVPDFALIYGNPARIHGFVCKCGKKLEKMKNPPAGGQKNIKFSCSCGQVIEIPPEIYKLKVENSPKRKIWIR